MNCSNLYFHNNIQLSCGVHQQLYWQSYRLFGDIALGHAVWCSCISTVNLPMWLFFVRRTSDYINALIMFRPYYVFMVVDVSA